MNWSPFLESILLDRVKSLDYSTFPLKGKACGASDGSIATTGMEGAFKKLNARR
jgi:hypothetical protein